MIPDTGIDTVLRAVFEQDKTTQVVFRAAKGAPHVRIGKLMVVSLSPEEVPEHEDDAAQAGIPAALQINQLVTDHPTPGEVHAISIPRIR